MLDPFLRLPGFDITPGERSHKLPAGFSQKHSFTPQWEREKLHFESMRSGFVLLMSKNVLFHRKVLRSLGSPQHERTFSGRLKHVLTSRP